MYSEHTVFICIIKKILIISVLTLYIILDTYKAEHFIHLHILSYNIMFLLLCQTNISGILIDKYILFSYHAFNLEYESSSRKFKSHLVQ